MPEDIWTEDPNYPISDWKYEVANDDTRLGYWDWVEHKKEAGWPPTEEEPHQYRNFYRHCGEEWDDTWSCMCNDRCPVCNAEIEPYKSEDMEDEDE